MIHLHRSPTSLRIPASATHRPQLCRLLFGHPPLSVLPLPLEPLGLSGPLPLRGEHLTMGEGRR